MNCVGPQQGDGFGKPRRSRDSLREFLLSSFVLAFAFVFVVSMLSVLPATAQEEEEEAATEGGQSRESMAVDATATQWSFQFAVEGNFNYKDDEIAPGVTRPEGGLGFLQFRFVAPVAKSEKIPFTMLPRLTMRAVEDKNGKYGFGQSDIFILGIVDQWATGRWGIGPQINFPADKGFGNPEWGFGLAGAVTQRAMKDKLFLALLLQQTWSKDPDPDGSGDTKPSPLGINPVIVYQLGNGFYIGNGDFVIRYNWNDGSWFWPLRVRLGKAWILPEKTYNAYIEYGTALDFKDWKGAVPEHTVRLNFQFQIPVS